MAGAQILNQLLEQMGLTCVKYQPRRQGKRTRIYELDPVVYEQQMEILERRKALRERTNEDDTAPLFNYSIIGDCAANPKGIQPLEIGALEQWQWGTSLSPWVIQDEVGQMVTIRGSSGVTFIVGKQELVPWDGTD